MFNFSIFVFILGWVLWFLIDKQPPALGMVLPEEMSDMLDNFQLSFDILKAGYFKASYVFIWKAHYFVLSVIGGVLGTIMMDGGMRVLRRRHLRDLMWPQKKSSTNQPANQATSQPTNLGNEHSRDE